MVCVCVCFSCFCNFCLLLFQTCPEIRHHGSSFMSTCLLHSYLRKHASQFITTSILILFIVTCVRFSLGLYCVNLEFKHSRCGPVVKIINLYLWAMFDLLSFDIFRLNRYCIVLEVSFKWGLRSPFFGYMLGYYILCIHIW